MICPKCGVAMEQLAVDSIEVDRCSHCQGLFFDMLEAEDLAEMRNASAVDSGPAEIGRGRNVHIDIRCPVDGARMVHMVDPVQQHIEFESCPRCHGAFYDAGEYSDLTRRTVLDWFRTARARRDRLR